MIAALALGALALPSQTSGSADADPLAHFEESLRPHPYLGRIVYTRVDDFAPFHFFVKRPDADEPGYYARVAGHYAPWLRELERIFVTQYAEPLGLEPRAGHPFYALFVLDSSGAYKDYADAGRTFGLYAARAHYDPELGLAVTYENVYQPESPSQHRRAALHELVHALQHAYYPDPGRLPPVAWFNEGLADYLSYCEGLVPEALYAKKPDRDALQLVAGLAQVPGALQEGLFPLEELAALRDYAEVEAHALARGNGRQLVMEGESLTIPLFYAQSSLWTFFLHHGEDGRHREAYLRYAGSVWSGDGGPKALRVAFEGIDLVELDRAFRRWLKETIARDLRVTAPIPAEAVRSATSLPDRPPALVKAFEPAELRPDPADAEVALALALADARRGALAAAEERLDALAAVAPESLRGRVERERGRVADFRALRRRYFEHVARPDARKLDADLEGQKLVAQVIALEGESVRLGSNKRGIEVLELDRLPVLTVAELARDRKYGFDAGPAAAWAYVVAGDPRWEKLAPAGDPLRADAEADYPGRLALAHAAGELLRLADAGAPADAATATATLGSVAALLRDSGDLPLVRERRPALRALARTALELEFAAGGLAASLRGELQELGEGRVRLRYGFESAAELEDFTQDGYLASHAFGKPQVSFEHAAGKLVARGFACLRSRLAFQGPQRVQCRARYSEPAGAFDPRFLFLLGCNDDGQVGYAAADLTGGLQVLDPAENHVQRSPDGGSLLLDEMQSLELVFDGSSVTSRVNGAQRATLSAGPRTSGAVFVFSAADLVCEVDELVVEGTPTPESLELLRAEWIAGRLAELGLE